MKQIENLLKFIRASRKQTENIAVPNPQNMDEYQTTPESTYRADVIDAMVQGLDH